jgi:hypothetical protein
VEELGAAAEEPARNKLVPIRSWSNEARKVRQIARARMGR